MDLQQQQQQTSKKISQHSINLIIILIIGVLLLFDFGFRSTTSYLEQLRFFVTFGSSSDLLARLLPVRIGLAFVFLWYSIDNFIHPEVINNLTNILLKKAKLERESMKLYPFAYLQSIIEFLIGVSLVTGIYIDLASLVGTILLASILFAYEEGLGSLLIRDVGLLGAMSTLFLLTTSARI